MAIGKHQEEKEKLSTSKEEDLHRFAQQVRRFYPFSPFLPARVKDDFYYHDYLFSKGTLVLLDIYGTNHHPLLWENPERFNPSRFLHWSNSPFSFIPQGGGHYELGHRCAGEWITMEIMKESIDFLAKKLAYLIPLQDVSYKMNKFPSPPHSKIILTGIKKADN